MDDTIEQTDGMVRGMASMLMTPDHGECLYCYVDRMLSEYRCDHTLRFAEHYGAVCAPRATALRRRLINAGGFCDCEIFMNAVCHVSELIPPGLGDDGVVVALFGERPPPAALAPRSSPDMGRVCRAVRAGSTQPCGLWRPRWRW